MTVETFENGGYVITGDSVPRYRLLMLRQGLKMEIKGLRISSHRFSAYSIIKKEFNLKGSKRKVLEQFEDLLCEQFGFDFTAGS
jgi:hypothetical protein